MPTRSQSISFAASLLYLSAFCCTAQDSRRIYSDLANGEAVLKSAVDDALRESKRILITWGMNDDPSSVALDETLMTNDKIVAVLDTDYVFTRINSDQNRATAESLGIEITSIPAVTVVDAFEGVLAVKEYGNKTPSASELLPFLYQWKAKPSAATKALDKSRLTAQRKDKAVFVLFSTTWCGYCKRLKTMMSDPEIAAMISPYVDILEIDQEQLGGARELRYRLQRTPDGGIPWYAIVGNDGETVATSSSGLGRNIAMPSRKDSIKWFVEMIRRSSPKMTDEECYALVDAITAYGHAGAASTIEESAGKLTVR